MAKIYLTRHGQTVWNLERRFQGAQDSPLTETGNKQAALLSRRLEDVKFNRVYCSPLGRTKETARLVTGELYPMEYCEALKEINLGVLEGKTRDELMGSDKEQFDNFWNSPENFTIEGGESFQDVHNRVIPFFLEEIDHSLENILIVTHAVVKKVIISYLKGSPLSKIWEAPFTQPTSLTVIEPESKGFRLSLVSDASHLEELGSESHSAGWAVKR